MIYMTALKKKRGLKLGDCGEPIALDVRAS